MKKKSAVLLLILLVFSSFESILADSIDQEIKIKAAAVKKLHLGFDNYILGAKLTNAQQKFSQKHLLPVSPSKQWTSKFIDGTVYVVIDKKTKLIIGIYKEKQKASQGDMKIMVGDLMMRFEEPTLLAHDKIIYWAYDRKGKISRDTFEQLRDQSGISPLAIVKFSSSQPELQDTHSDRQKDDSPPRDIYVIISSDPLASLLMAKNEH